MKSQLRIEQQDNRARFRSLLHGGRVCLLLLTCLSLCGAMAPTAHAAGHGFLSGALVGMYDDDQPESNSGPVRLARFSYLNGDVTWRADAQSDWSAAAHNMPLRQGAQIWVGDAGRAEVQFDDGSRMRLDSNTLVTLQTLYSDADGEFTELTLNEGEIFLRLTNQFALYQVNTPAASLKASGPARLRVGGGEGAQFAARQGKATIEGANGKVTLQEGDFLDVVDNNSPYNVGPLPQPDAWDTWNDLRDRQIDDPAHVQTHLPPNIALVAGNLDAYGRWVNDPAYGWIWAPNVSDPDWRPYGAGSWTWVEPFGWTWVGAEPWGWAPYHYGTWVRASYGWGWCPGPATQYWSPAVVSFYESGTRVAWCPLAPREVVYPSVLSVGFRSGNWSLFFSIGSAAVYYPGPDRVCVARPWASTYVNRVTYVTNVTNVTNITVNRNTYVTNNFVPSNARFAGGTQVEVANFAGNRSAYRPVAGADLAVFSRGRAIGAPTGGSPIAGPQAVRVTPQAFTPTRTFAAARVPQEVVNRSVFRTALPANVPRAVAAPQAGQRFITRTGPATTTGGNRTNTSTGSTGRPSALEDYLRERDAARNGRSTDTSSSGSSRTSQGSSGAGNGEKTSGSSSTTHPPRTNSYRPLHTHSSSGAHDSGSRSSGRDGDSKGNDKGH